MEKRSDEIAAICTPTGKSGIGIVRVSGSDSLTKISQLIQSNADVNSFSLSEKRRIANATLYSLNKEKIDEILLLYFPKTKSFTGEIAIELQCHGGRAVLNEALKAVLSTGIRSAEPGEFTWRAVYNKRITLMQAETINALINARTKKALSASWIQYEGKIADRCNELRASLTGVISDVYALIDFNIEQQDQSIIWNEKLITCISQIEEMSSSAERCKYLLNGCRVVFIGPPNVGKSSIFNAILNIERSIVSDEPGTTRDHIDEVIELSGAEVRLVDTAGIRETKDKIEQISINKTKKQIENADIIVLVLDCTTKIDKYFLPIIEEILQKDGYIIFNKHDLELNKHVNEFKNTHFEENVLFVSVKENAGLDVFLKKLADKIEKHIGNFESGEVINIRQAEALSKAKTGLIKATELIKNNNSLDFIVFEIEEATKALREIIGDIDNEEVLNKIFGKFCIGK